MKITQTSQLKSGRQSFLVHPLKKSQQLIVNVHINAKGESKELKIANMQDHQLIAREIQEFVRFHRIKHEACIFIHDIVIDEIQKQKKHPSHSKSTHKNCKNCKCQCEKKQTRYIEKEKIYSNMSHAKQQTNQPLNAALEKNKKNKKSPARMGIQLAFKTLKTPPSSSSKKQRHLPNIFSSTFTLASSLSEQQKILGEDLSNPLSGEVDSKQFAKKLSIQNQEHSFIPKFFENDNCENLFTNRSKVIEIEQEQIKSAKKQRSKQRQVLKQMIDKNAKINKYLAFPVKIDESQDSKENNLKIIKLKTPKSTKERKQAIMSKSSSKKERIEQSDLNKSLQIQEMATFHFEINDSSNQFLQIQEKKSSQSACSLLGSLFKKLINRNPFGITNMNPNYIDYGSLTERQLWFMNKLFQKMEVLDLENLTLENFKIKSLKYCPEEIHQLLIRRE